MNRLTSATVNGTATTYSYDRYGNRVSQTPGPTVPPLANNQLQGFSYDAAGNLMQDAAGNQYQYDAEGNVLSANSVSAGRVTYIYDAFNQRVQQAQGSSYFEYDFDALGRRVSEWSQGNAVQGQYYAGTGQGVGYYYNGSIHFQHKDWLGTERLRTTYNGSVDGRFNQGAFGDNPQLTAGSDTDSAHFAGQDLDWITGTSHAQFRQLDIAHGKWMSPDPYDGSYDLSNPQSLNRYAYVLNNPLGLKDPFGLDWSGAFGLCYLTASNCGGSGVGGGGVGLGQLQMYYSSTSVNYTICSDSGCWNLGANQYDQAVHASNNGNTVSNQEIRSDADNNISGYVDITLVGGVFNNIGGSLSTINQIALPSPDVPINQAPSVLTRSLPTVGPVTHPAALNNAQKRNLCLTATILRNSGVNPSFGPDAPTYSVDHSYHGSVGVSAPADNLVQGVAASASLLSDFGTCMSLLR